MNPNLHISCFWIIQYLRFKHSQPALKQFYLINAQGINKCSIFLVAEQFKYQVSDLVCLGKVLSILLLLNPRLFAVL